MELSLRSKKIGNYTTFEYSGGLPGLQKLKGNIYVDPDNGVKKSGINEIEIDEAYRRKGLGKAIVSSLEKWLMVQGVKVIELNSERDAISFWKSVGYKGRNSRSGLSHFEKSMDREENSMPVLTAKQRNRLSEQDFAIPEQRKYPIPDINHARDALARVSAFGTPGEQTKVRQAVYAKYPQLYSEIIIHNKGVVKHYAALGEDTHTGGEGVVVTDARTPQTLNHGISGRRVRITPRMRRLR